MIGESYYKKIVSKPEKIDSMFIDVFIESYSKPPDRIVLDIDATDDPLQRKLEFDLHAKNYIFLPGEPNFLFKIYLMRNAG